MKYNENYIYANTTDEFINGRYNAGYVPQIGIHIKNLEQRLTLDYVGSFNYGDELGEKQLGMLRKRVSDFNKMNRNYSRSCGIPVFVKRVDVKKRKNHCDVYMYDNLFYEGAA